MPPTDAETFDYVIVGAGSAGCVLANRLTADGRHRVLLLEFGGSDRSIFIQMPAALAYPMNTTRWNWRYESEPEPHLNNRRLHCPRGKGLGGSSSINGLVYVRGNPLDFEHWQEQGARGWGYANVLPYFKRAETRLEGGNAYRGGDGPLSTTYGTLDNPLHHAWMEAARQAGYQLTEDYNGFRQEGFGRMDMTVRNGERCSSAKAHLYDAVKRPNLQVVQHALATRILFDGTRAVGVEYERGGTLHTVRAGREVILSGGPINSVQLLKLSGIGPAQELAGHGIPVLADRAGVGANLQDHLEFYFQMACTSRSPCSAMPTCWARPGSASNGCCAARAWARPTTLNPAVSSAAAPASAIPISSTTSSRWPSITMAPRSPPSMASKPTSGRCARKAVARSRCAVPIRATRR
ncbi:GMC family oxidoreductase N-terminal domain-containing protein [Novosphingobium pokkalii]|uniref:GMC family oxidoreductase N-terminal domain-containing protein n=1 Tax=Novosphingobium pokkalii TaxID=1770194 RepID=UPI0036314973